MGNAPYYIIAVGLSAVVCCFALPALCSESPKPIMDKKEKKEKKKTSCKGSRKGSRKGSYKKHVNGADEPLL